MVNIHIPNKVKQKLKKIFTPANSQQKTIKVRLLNAQPNSWIKEHLVFINDTKINISQNNNLFSKIEKISEKTQRLGSKPLWEGYSDVSNYPWPVERGAKRTSNQVRTSRKIGEIFTWIISQRKPSVVVEFGAAFGVSGMYWLAGLEKNGYGELLTFEPNAVWAQIAQKNLSFISNRFKLTVGTFEENIDEVLQERNIDIAFIDAIHTCEFVMPQFQIVANRLAPGGIIVFDDIDFSKDMSLCWEKICHDRRIAASAVFCGTGIVEFV